MPLENIFSPTFKHQVPRLRRRRTNLGAADIDNLKKFRRQNDAQDVPLRIENLDMDRSVLRHAFELAAEYLRSKDLSLTIIAVGGTNYPIVLPMQRTRQRSALIQLSGNTEERKSLDEAVEFARRKSPTYLPADWLNTKGGLRLPLATQAKITIEALAQNDVVFSTLGLTVLAAPWKYAFCVKIDRLMQDNHRGYDLSDAVAYLHRHIQRHDGRPIVARLILRWASDYHLHTSQRVLRAVRQEYRRRYRRHAIIGCLCDRSQKQCECYAAS